MKKKNRVPLAALFMTACIALSLIVGISIGKSAGDNHMMLQDRIDRYFEDDTREDLPATSGGNPVPDVAINPVPEEGDSGYLTTEIYKKVLPSIVNISGYTNQSVSAASTGSGIVMTRDGYIITNAHVVKGCSYVNATFSDGEQLRGEIVGLDEATDLAVVKVDARGLTPAEFGDSTRLEVGERTVVIGNAGGLSGSCTQGIISGLNREVDSSRRSLSLIQTSAAINPGNSGGALLNRFGQVIGITSSKIASVNYEGIGFAIPISDAMPIIESLIANGYVAGRAILGVSIIELNSANGPINNLPNYGAYIAEIDSRSLIDEAGARRGDVILKANGVTIDNSNILLNEVNKFKPGEKIELEIYRKETDKTFTIKVELIESKS